MKNYNDDLSSFSFEVLHNTQDKAKENTDEATDIHRMFVSLLETHTLVQHELMLSDAGSSWTDCLSPQAVWNLM